MADQLTMLIVDDEEAARTVLRYLVESCFPEDEIVGEAASAMEGLKLIQKLKPQLVFLDISMPYADGFDLLESLSERNFEVIFTTSHQEHAIRALREGAIDYLLKPILEDDFVKAVNRVRERIGSPAEESVSVGDWEQKIKVTQGKEIVYLPVAEILHIEACGAYSKVHAGEARTFTVSKNLRHFEQLLHPLPFFRIHNSHLVNLKMVDGFLNDDGGFVRLRNGSMVPASSRKVADFHRAMEDFLR
ncbi:MAG: LytTR family DNA-binding domain-containing protein [Bacteroidota bacterium]